MDVTTSSLGRCIDDSIRESLELSSLPWFLQEYFVGSMSVLLLRLRLASPGRVDDERAEIMEGTVRRLGATPYSRLVRESRVTVPFTLYGNPVV